MITVMPVRKISSITSCISHFAPFIHHGRLQLRFLQFWIKRHWAQHRQSWNTPLQLNAEFLSHLRWFNKQDVLQGVPLHLPEPNLFFFTDASLTGWGASWQDPYLEGQWSPQDSNQHINWLELEAIRLAVLKWGLLWINQTAHIYCDNSTAVDHIRKQEGTHSISLFNKTLELFHLLGQFGILLIPTHLPGMLPGARNVTADTLSKSDRMAASSGNLTQAVLCLRNPPSAHVRHGREPGDSNLHFTVPWRQSLGSRRPLHIMGRLTPSVRLPTSSHRPQDSPENQGLSRHHNDSDRLPAPVSSVAPPTTTTQPTSSHFADRRGSLPVRAKHAMAPVPQGASPVRSSRVAIIRDILKQHDFPDSVIDMAADPLHDSSSHVYNSRWKAFAKWANDKDI